MRSGLLTLLLPAAGLLLGAGCTTIDSHDKVAGWPKLRLVEHRVSDEVLFARCSKYMPWGSLPEACSEFYFDSGECHMWFSKDYPPQPWVVKHEVMHCEGYEHDGETALHEILARYNAQRRVTGNAVSGSGSRPPG